MIYPLQLVQDKLLEQQAAGEWSNLLYTLYILNPLADIIDAFQSVGSIGYGTRHNLGCDPAPSKLRLLQADEVLFRGCDLRQRVGINGLRVKI